MKEKVIILNESYGISESKAWEINNFLEMGWTVKSVNITAEKEQTTAIFVLSIDN